MYNRATNSPDPTDRLNFSDCIKKAMIAVIPIPIEQKNTEGLHYPEPVKFDKLCQAQIEQ